MSPPGPLVVRQLLAGRDFAQQDASAMQMANYVYALCDPASRRAILVDPAWAPAELTQLLAEDGYRLDGVLLTHYHADHAGGPLFGQLSVPGVAELLDEVEVPVHAQRAEVAWLERATGLPAGAFVGHDAGDVVALGRGQVTLVHTPGHTPGSQCLLFGDAVLTGDTLFLRGCGRTDLPGGDAAALHHSLSSRLAPLPDDTRVFPGHAYDRAPHATIGDLRRTNPVLAPLAADQWLARFGG